MCVNFRKLICIDVILKGVKSRIKKKGGVSRKKKIVPWSILLYFDSVHWHGMCNALDLPDGSVLRAVDGRF